MIQFLITRIEQRNYNNFFNIIKKRFFPICLPYKFSYRSAVVNYVGYKNNCFIFLVIILKIKFIFKLVVI